MPLFRTVLWVLIVSLIALAALGIAALLLPEFVPQSERILASAALFAGFSLFALACALSLERGRARLAMIVGLIAGIAALAIWLGFIWFDAMLRPVEEAFLRTGGVLTTTFVWATFIAIVLTRQAELISMKRVQMVAIALGSLVALYFIFVIAFGFGEWWILRGTGSTMTVLVWLAWASMFVRLAPSNVKVHRLVQATMVCSIVLAAYIFLLIWGDGPHRDWIERLLGVLIILTVCGTLVTLSFATIERLGKRHRAETVPGRLMLTMTCPRCDTSQQLHAGRAQCKQCGLRIGVEIEEPRCACGYLLYKLTGEKCPECGRTIPETDRWAARQEDAQLAMPSTSAVQD